MLTEEKAYGPFFVIFGKVSQRWQWVFEPYCDCRWNMDLSLNTRDQMIILWIASVAVKTTKIQADSIALNNYGYSLLELESHPFGWLHPTKDDNKYGSGLWNILTKLQWAIQNHDSGLLTTALWDQFRWKMLDHLPYSFDLVPSDILFFPKDVMCLWTQK